MRSVSLCVIARNEEEVLGRCLSTVADLVDEIIVVDTGSTDRTRAIARDFGARVEAFPWRDDFAAARNHSFSLATSDWILWLDADDVLLPHARDGFRALKAHLEHDIYYLPYDYAQDETGASICTLWRERILKRTPTLRWLYPVHECVLITHDMSSARVDVTVTHRRTPSGAATDAERNLRILRRAIRRPSSRHEPRLRYYLARELQDAGRDREACAAYEAFLAMQGGWDEDRICAQHRLAACRLRLANKEPARAAAHRAAAVRAAKDARRADARWAEPCVVLGQAAFAEEDWAEAAFWFEQALRPAPPVLSPLDRHAYDVVPATQLCLAYDRLGDVARVNRYNEVALALRPQDRNLLYNRSYCRSQLAPLLRGARLGFTRERRDGWIWCGEPPAPADAVAAPFAQVFPLDALPVDDGSLEGIAVDAVLTPERAAVCAREWRRALAPGGDVALECRGGAPADDEAIAAACRDADLVLDYAGRHDDRFAIRAVAPRGPRRVGFVGACDLRLPQFRIRIFHVDRWLRAQGWRSEIVEPDRMLDCDTLVFYRAYTAGEHALMLAAKQAGKRVLLDIAEDLFDAAADFPWYQPMVAAADLVVCCSRRLAERVRAAGAPAIVIEDAVEAGFDRRADYDPRHTLTVGWIGMPENARHAERLRPLIARAGHRLVTIHSGPDADVPWDLFGWSRALAHCDVAIAPADVAAQPSKSNNKITTCMALGLPVVCSPLDAYLAIVRDGENGIVARTDDEWVAALDRLRDAGTRARIGRAGQSAARAFALDAIASRWAALLFDAAAAPEVDIVIPTCGNHAYLAACLASIAACSADVSYRVILVANNGCADDLPSIDPRTTTVLAHDARLTYAEATNAGVAAGSAPYVCLLNDDTIVSRGWLTTLLETARSGASLVNPLSNAERGWIHDYDLAIGGVPLLPGANQLAGGQVFADGAPHATVPVDALWTYAPGKTRVLDREWVAFYCTLIPRAVLAEVGPLDEGFVNGFEDVDFCHRARRLGHRAVIDERSFVFHFGSRSTMAPAMAAVQGTREAGNRARWATKWEKPLFVLHAGYAWEPWTPDAIEQGIGGAETAAVHVCEALGRLGWRVVLFGCCPGREGIYGAVEYRDVSAFDAFIARHHIDVFVASRWVDALERPLRASRRYLWIHDVWAMGTPLGDGDRLRAIAPRLDGILCLSPWHRDHVARVHGLTTDRIHVTRNGIDAERFAATGTRQPGRFIYSSSPDRGLDVLLDLFPRIRAELPDAELHVFYGFDNWDKSLRANPDPAQVAWRERIVHAMQQPGVHHHGRVGQRQLADEMRQSDVWLYPTSFCETYCITALEAQAAGVACVCSDLAGLSTTVGDRGVLVPGDPRSPEYQARAIAAALDLVRDRPRRDALTDRARAWALTQTWTTLAEEWQSLFRGDTPRAEASDVAARA